ncbi:pR34 [rat cytomegalovirus strain Maastricht]|uniref:PR34 n=1 Tax=Rat cytomegalovirus (strain Maastricht) TaxID=79700 RepID=Q9DWF7_RCMVM|nr:pR34 [rat cytomegalovirus strain Maastricht]AAF99132.1 pR34 [rat cytomegalovirus strain Maastricht]WEG71958.1 protein UL34 [Murid betaherpesvirus 2]
METNPVSRGSVGDPERAFSRHDHGNDHPPRGGGRDRRHQLTRTRSDEVTGAPYRKRAKHSRHDREPDRRGTRPRHLSETSHTAYRYRLGSGGERSPTYPGPSPMGGRARFRRGETEKPPPSSDRRPQASCRPRKEPPGAAETAERSPPRPRSHPRPSRPPGSAPQPSSPPATTTPPPIPHQTRPPSPKKEPRPGPSRREYDGAYRSALAENFIRSVSGTYKMMNRAEERKRILSNQLPSCIKSKSIANSFIFCTPADGDHLEAEIATTRRHQKRIVDFGRLDAVIQGVSCRVRRRPMSATLTSRQTELIRAVRVISVAFNRITFVARIKHYCDRDTRLANYLRDELTKRCSEGSRLNCGIRQFIGLVDLERHRDLCLIFVGMLSQTPHMWARSIRLLSRLKIFYQNTLVKLFADEKVDLKDVFDLPYHSTAQKILSQVKQYTASAFTLNDVVGGVVDAMRQRRAAPPLTFASMPSRPASSSAAAAMAMATTMYDDHARYDPFGPPGGSPTPPETTEYTFYPNAGRGSRSPSSDGDEEDEEEEDEEEEEEEDTTDRGRDSPRYRDRETDTDSSVRTSPGRRTPPSHDSYDLLLKNGGLRYDDPFSSSSSVCSLPAEILQPPPLTPRPVPPSADRRTPAGSRSPRADEPQSDGSSSSSPSSSSSSPSSSGSSGSGSSGSSRSSVSEEPMTVSPYRGGARGGPAIDATAMLKYPGDPATGAGFGFPTPMHYLERDPENPQNYISVHVGRSSPPGARTRRECINIMLDSR